jgi:hypothetical protein
MFPCVIILIALGIWEVISLFKKKGYFLFSSVIIIILYSYLLFNFLNIYFYQFTLQGYFDFNLRLFSKYLVISKNPNEPVFVYSPNASDIFKKYIFYSNSYNKNNVVKIRTIYKTNKFSIDNIKFLGCDNTIDPAKINAIVVYDVLCGALRNNSHHLSISRLSDGGENFKIFNDKICSSYSLKAYPANIKISDFSIEQQPPKHFCETYVTSH